MKPLLPLCPTARRAPRRAGVIAWLCLTALPGAAAADCTVTVVADSGAGSLRDCIAVANAAPGSTIRFDIAPPTNQSSGADSWWRIMPASALPAIIAAGTVVDATTQTANRGDTNSRGPEIELFGNNAVTNGLQINNAANVTVRGLVVNRFTQQGILLIGAGVTQARIRGNYLGTDAVGAAALANGFSGVSLQTGPSDNDIGGPNPGDGNLISGNGNYGVHIGQGSNNRVHGNLIGTDRLGSAAIGNGRGAYLAGTSSGNRIGGLQAGEANVIAHSGVHGVEIAGLAASNLVAGNTIRNNTQNGVLLTGTNNTISANVIAGNGGASFDGVSIQASATGTRIYHNTIHGSGGHGVLIAATGAILRNNIVTGSGGFGLRRSAASWTENYNLLTDAATSPANASGQSDTALSNADLNVDPLYTNAAAGDYSLGACTSPAIEAGIDLGADQPDLNGAAAGLFNGLAPDLGARESSCASSCPVVTSNANSGVNSLRTCLLHANANPGTTIRFNIPGPPDQTSGADGWWRIAVTSPMPAITANGTTLDGTSQTLSQGDTNSRGPEIELQGNASTSGFGVSVNGASAVTIRGLVIGRFSEGIALSGGASGTRMLGNYIGTNAVGEAASGNTDCGVALGDSVAPEIGGPIPGDGNLISGNSTCGIVLSSSINARIRGNRVGVNRSATARITNGLLGIAIVGASSGAVIGGPNPGDGNIVSGNSIGIGPFGTWNVTNITIQGNIVGTGATGTEAGIGNFNTGIAATSLAGAGNFRIGGVNPGEGNLSAYNGSVGIDLGSAGSGNRIEGNIVRNNGQSGLRSASAGVVIAKNTVWANGTGSEDGIVVRPGAVNNRLFHNTVHANRGDGISLEAIGAVLRNNIVTGNGGYGINRVAANMTVSHNTVTDAATAPANALGRSNISLGSTDINVDPLFTNAATGDFNLVSCDSPSAEAGLDLGVDQPDMNGAAAGLWNGIAPDMGAWESSCVSSCPVVTTNNDLGVSALRSCIRYANDRPGTTVSFDIPPPGNQGNGPDSWWRITLGSDLPSINAANTVIDGASQRLNRGDTNSRGPEIEISCNNTVNNGIMINNVANTTLRELIVNRCTSFGIYILGVGGSQNRVHGSYVGTDAVGEAAAGNGQAGVLVLAGANNDVGGPNPGEGNLLSGNGTHGVYVASATNNRIRGNRIGVDRTGTALIPNSNDGVNIASGSGNRVGGLATGEGNIIAGSGQHGVNGGGPDITVEANVLRNNGASGVFVAGNNAVVRKNLVAGNGGVGNPGISAWSGANTRLLHNTVHGNNGDGMLVRTAGVTLRNNLITGNSGYGINLTAAGMSESHNGVTDALTAPANALGRSNAALDPTGINADPQYQSAAGGNFALIECSSPAINRGTDLGADQPDMNGAAAGLYNNNAPDLGAYESSSACGPNLTITKQIWLEGGTAPLTSPVTLPAGAEAVFLIYVRNTTGGAVTDLRITDSLDETGFRYLPGSLLASSAATPPADSATDLALFTATAPGTGTALSDNVDADIGSAQDSGGPAGADRLTLGAVPGQANAALNLPANSSVAVRFKVVVR